MHAVADFLTRRSDRMPTEQEAAETSPSTPRKKKNLNNASPMSASPDKLNTPSKTSLEEVKQSTATNFYATLKYYDPASTAEQRAQEVCRMINNNATLKPAMVARGGPPCGERRTCEARRRAKSRRVGTSECGKACGSAAESRAAQDGGYSGKIARKRGHPVANAPTPPRGRGDDDSSALHDEGRRSGVQSSQVR